MPVPPTPPETDPFYAIFLLFVRIKNVKNTTQVAKFAPWGPCPYHLPPQNAKPLDPPPRALVPSPTPQGNLQKTPFFFFLHALETSKIRHKLRNLLRPWGPCPYHLPPRNQSPWTALPEPLYPPPPHRGTFKKRHFFLLFVQTSKIRRKLRNLLRPWGPCPYHLPPQNRSPDPPRAPDLGPRGLGHPCHSLKPSPNPPPSFELVYPPLLWGRAPTTYPPTTEALKPLPEPQARVSGPRFPSTVLNSQPSLNPPPSLELPSSPCAPPNPLLQPRPRPLEPVPVPPTPPEPILSTPFFFFLYALETSKIRHKLRNLLRPWGPCPYHLPPQNRSPWTPLPEPLQRSPGSDAFS